MTIPELNNNNKFKLLIVGNLKFLGRGREGFQKIYKIFNVRENKCIFYLFLYTRGGKQVYGKVMLMALSYYFSSEILRPKNHA